MVTPCVTMGYGLLNNYFKTLLVCMHAQLGPIPCNSMDCSPPGSSPWGFPGKNSGVGCHFLLQGIFPTQGWKVSTVSLALADGFFFFFIT